MKDLFVEKMKEFECRYKVKFENFDMKFSYKGNDDWVSVRMWYIDNRNILVSSDWFSKGNIKDILEEFVYDVEQLLKAEGKRNGIGIGI